MYKLLPKLWQLNIIYTAGHDCARFCFPYNAFGSLDTMACSAFNIITVVSCVFSGNQTHNLCTANATKLRDFWCVIMTRFVESQSKNPLSLESHSCISPTSIRSNYHFWTVTRFFCFHCDFLLKYSNSHKPWFQYDESSGSLWTN